MLTEEAHKEAHGGTIPETEEELSEDKKQRAKTAGINAGIDGLIDVTYATNPIVKGGVDLVKSGMELYQITYESHPKNPDRNPIGYKDYSEDDYKRMIKVLHKGVFG